MSEVFRQIIDRLDLRHAIQNVSCRMLWLQTEQGLIPATLNEKPDQSSYVSSPYTAYVLYGQNEFEHLNPAKALLLRPLFAILSLWLKLAAIDRNLTINNWLFSTNIHPNWTDDSLDSFTSLSTSHPNHALMIRSLNSVQNADLIDQLHQRGWWMLPARQVYLFTAEQALARKKRNNNQNDRRLLRKTHLIHVLPKEHTLRDFPQMHQVFKKLFIDKHSQYNPQYSADYFWQLHQAGLVEFHSLRDPQSGNIVGTMGLFSQHQTVTLPIIGYDTDLPKEWGIYRLLIAKLMGLVEQREQLLNLSSGAGEFKRQRGGEPVIEYSAVYLNHLPYFRRQLLKSFIRLMQITLPKAFRHYQV